MRYVLVDLVTNEVTTSFVLDTKEQRVIDAFGVDLGHDAWFPPEGFVAVPANEPNVNGDIPDNGHLWDGRQFSGARISLVEQPTARQRCERLLAGAGLTIADLRQVLAET